MTTQQMDEKDDDTRDGGYEARAATWIVYDNAQDLEVVVPFGREIVALRYAVDQGLNIIKVPHGVTLKDAIDAEVAAKSPTRPAWRGRPVADNPQG